MTMEFTLLQWLGHIVQVGKINMCRILVETCFGRWSLLGTSSREGIQLGMALEK
jgi:hypothetical protein